MRTMATRSTADAKTPLNECQTDYVLHKSQQTLFTGIQKKVIDFTEHKLLKYAHVTQDAQQKLVLMVMVSDYVSGKIAVAWANGRPIYIRVTKEAQ